MNVTISGNGVTVPFGVATVQSEKIIFFPTKMSAPAYLPYQLQFFKDAGYIDNSKDLQWSNYDGQLGSNVAVKVCSLGEPSQAPLRDSACLLPFGQEYYYYLSQKQKHPTHSVHYGNEWRITQELLELERQQALEQANNAGEDLSNEHQDKDAIETSVVHSFDDLYEDQESRNLFLLDPAKWKDQDHYAILGLGRMRFSCNEDDIKRAYRRKALKYHPDKSKGTGGNALHENYFKCVQKSYEFMSDPVKRRQFDSVDPAFDEHIPTESEVKQNGFFKTLAPVFARNAHFSKVQPVPHLGTDQTPKQKVDQFYAFWAKFSTWRSFELRDEESAGENVSRDERRWIDKQNKSKRQQHVKEDRARLLKLIDLAMRLDPRLQRYRQAERDEKEARKLAKQMEKQVVIDAEAEKRREVERIEKERLEVEEREKKQRKDLKGEIKTLRRDIRAIIIDDLKHFGKPKYVVEDQIVKTMAFIGQDVERLTALRTNLQDKVNAQMYFDQAMTNVETPTASQEDAKKKQADLDLHAKRKLEQSASSESVKVQEAEWTADETKHLIKAVNMYPGGMQRRWEVIAEYVQQHSPDGTALRTPAEIIKKTKEVKSGQFVGNAAQFQTFEKKREVFINDAPTLREVAASDLNSESKSAAKPLPWSTAEQAKLEAAMKAYPTAGPNAYTGADRWDKIAAMVEGRSKKEILVRVKEIIQTMKQ